jgi:hypothetical protein
MPHEHVARIVSLAIPSISTVALALKGIPLGIALARIVVIRVVARAGPWASPAVGPVVIIAIANTVLTISGVVAPSWIVKHTRLLIETL